MQSAQALRGMLVQRKLWRLQDGFCLADDASLSGSHSVSTCRECSWHVQVIPEYRFHLSIPSTNRNEYSSPQDAQDDTRRQASSQHSRDKASSSNPCRKITTRCLCPFLGKNCHWLDNTHSWPQVAIDIMVTSLYLPYLSFGYASVVTCHQPHGARAADGPALRPLPWPHRV